MIKPLQILIFCFIALLLMPQISLAQFVNLRLTIEPELSTTVEQDLNFGTQIANSGRTEIQLGDTNVGIFSIRAYHTQNVYLSLSFPSAMRSQTSAITEEIPMDLRINYNNSGRNDPLSSIELTDNQGFVSIHETTETVTNRDIWKQMYIYVYGAIEVGNVPDGVYTADVILTIEYD